MLMERRGLAIAKLFLGERNEIMMGIKTRREQLLKTWSSDFCWEKGLVVD